MTTTNAMKVITNFAKIAKYFSMLCIGIGIALIIEYGLSVDFIVFIGVAIIDTFAYGIFVKHRENNDEEE